MLTDSYTHKHSDLTFYSQLLLEKSQVHLFYLESCCLADFPTLRGLMLGTGRIFIGINHNQDSSGNDYVFPENYLRSVFHFLFSYAQRWQIIVLVLQQVCEQKWCVYVGLGAYVWGLNDSSLTQMCKRQEPPARSHYVFISQSFFPGFSISSLLFLTQFLLSHSRVEDESKLTASCWQTDTLQLSTRANQNKPSYL